MNTNYQTRRIKEIKEELNKEIKTNECKIKAWRSVKRLHKKDGSNFAIRSKNFSGCSVDSKSTAWPKLTIYYHDPSRGYNSEVICLYVFDDDKKSGRPLIKLNGYRPYYELTIDEIFERITEKIKDLEQQNEELKKQLVLTETVFIEFVTAIDNALAELKEKVGDKSSLYYACREYAESCY